jgi:hypothetical protein
LWVPLGYATDMALRWTKTKDAHDMAFEPAEPEDDWVLVSGEFVVGRVRRDESNPEAGRFSWSLTGLQGASIGNHGMTGTLDAAQAELMAAWRLWQMLAEVRDAD